MKKLVLCIALLALTLVIAKSQTLSVICNGGNCLTPVSPNGTSYQYVGSLLNFSGCEPDSKMKCFYEWSITNGVITTSSSGIGTTSINVKWNNVNGNGSVKVKVSPSAQCSSCPNLEITQTLIIRYLGTPGTIKINGVAQSSATIPCGNAPITVSVDPVANATNYAWSLPAGWSGSANSNSIVVTPGANSQGSIKVSTSRSDVSGLVTESTVTTISRPLPVLNSSLPTGILTLCNGAQTITASASGTNADKFVWIPSGGTKINGATSQQTVAGNVAVSAISDGGYTVKAYSTACGLSSTNSESRTVWYGTAAYNNGYYTTNGLNFGLVESDDSYPNAFCWAGNPTQGDAKLDFSRLSTNNWTKLSSTPANLPWAQNQWNGIGLTFKATGQQGMFQMVFGNACGATTKWFGFTVVNCLQKLTVYPNPVAQDVITIAFDNVENAEVMPRQLDLFAENSKEPVRSVSAVDVFRNESFSDGNKIEIDVRTLPRGTYYLHIVHGAKVNKEKEKIRVVLN